MEAISQDFPEAKALMEYGWSHCGFWLGVSTYSSEDMNAFKQLKIQAINNKPLGSLSEGVGVESVFVVAKNISAADRAEVLRNIINEDLRRVVASNEGNVLEACITTHPKGELIFVGTDRYNRDGVELYMINLDDSEEDMSHDFIPVDQWELMRALYVKLWNRGTDSMGRCMLKDH